MDASNDMMRTPFYLLGKWLEAAVEERHGEGERLYWVTLGILGIQIDLRLSWVHA